jgi:hypothetical protein
MATMTAEERAARYEMALLAIAAISRPDGDIRKITQQALNVSVSITLPPGSEYQKRSRV